MVRIVNTGHARAQLSYLVSRAEAGEDVIIARNGVPAVRIVALNRPLAETVALMREERAQRTPISAADVRAAREEGRT